MEVKKSPKADLEGKKGIFFQVGLVLALATLLFAFEWKTSASEVSTFDIAAEEQVEEEIIPITQQMMKPPPPPPPAPKLTDLIDIVEDETTIDEELELTDVEDVSDNKDVSSTEDFGDYDGEDTGEAEIFQVVEDMPQFPHGNVQAWIAKNVKYPVIARENGIQGKIFIQFVIEKDGSITDVKVVRGVDPSLDKEASRVISSMPKWKPGKQRGKAVRVSYTLPINFTLQNY
ncbi:MAG: energy transducer TonB [Marinifilaceae bacterium]